MFAETAHDVVVVGKQSRENHNIDLPVVASQHGTGDKCPTSIIDLLIVAHMWT